MRQRRRWSIVEKMRLVEESYRSDEAINLIAKRHGINRSQIFAWRRLADKGMLADSATFKDVVSTVEHAALQKRVRDLEASLGKKTQEANSLVAALRLADVSKPHGLVATNLTNHLIFLAQSDQHDLSLRQLAVLALCQTGLGQTVRGMASALGIPRASVTRAVDRLEFAKYVQRLQDPFDGRSVVVVATRTGVAFLANVALRKRYLALPHSAA